MGAAFWRLGVAGCGLAMWLNAMPGPSVAATAVAGQQGSARTAAPPVAGRTDVAVPDSPSARHVRPCGRFVRQTAVLVGEAARRSPTVREMMASLDQSDLIVYVRLEPSLRNKTGTLAFLVASGGFRAVLISVGLLNFKDDTISWLGHELAHALEVSEAHDVRDSAGVAKLFARIGWRTPQDGLRYETTRAVDAGRQVWAELARCK